MEFTQNIVFEVPLWQMATLLFIMTICLAFGKYMLGLTIAILFIMYWGYVYNFDKFFNQPFEFNYLTLCFILVGGINAILLLVLFIFTFSLKD